MIRWDVTHVGSDPLTWFLILGGGGCRTTRRLAGETSRERRSRSRRSTCCAWRAAPRTPMQMLQEGRVKISGDIFFAAQLQGVCRIPAG